MVFDKKISVIMSTYNENETELRQSVESILNQTYSDFEFIIVLDNPGDKMIKTILSSYAESDHRIKLIENEDNLGLASSLNKAIELSTGEYIARMDADDISVPERFNRQISFIEEKKLDFVASNIMKFNEFEQLEKTRYPRNHFYISKSLKYTSALPHPTWLVKRSVYMRLNGYRLLETTQDYDFELRAKKIGVRFGLLEECLLRYRMRGQRVTGRKRVYQNTIHRYLAKNANIILEADPVQYSKTEKFQKDKRKIERYHLLTAKRDEYRRDKKILKCVIVWIIRAFTTETWIRLTICSIMVKILTVLDYLMKK
ncbi:hypothetical protein FACS189490_04420 [Clostridia bacterium]|nr:hypothetical protein FACS189490_04420 [Clostridia bacterium]